MTALLSGLIPYLIAAGGALLVVWKLWAGGKQAGIDQQKVKEAVARNDEIERIKNAAAAGDAVRPPMQPDDPGILSDPNNRDRASKK